MKHHEVFEEVSEEVMKQVEAAVNRVEMDRIKRSKERVGFFILKNPPCSGNQGVSSTHFTQMRCFFAFSMKDTMAPFIELFRPSVEIYWDFKPHEVLEEARGEVLKKVDAAVNMFEMDRIK